MSKIAGSTALVIEIESLRDQLAAAHAELEAERQRRWDGNRMASEELAHREAQIECIKSAYENMETYSDEMDAALAATDDLSGYILCEREPVLWSYTTNNTHEWQSRCKPPDDAYDAGSLVPLYRARRPECS